MAERTPKGSAFGVVGEKVHVDFGRLVTRMIHRIASSVWATGVGWRRFAEGDADAGTGIADGWQPVLRDYARSGPKVFRILLARYRSVDSAEIEDVVHEAFVRYHRTLKKGETIQQPEAWLLVVAQNLLRDRVKVERPNLYVEYDIATHDRIDEAAGTVADVFRRIVHSERFDEALAHLDTLVSPFQARCFRQRMANVALRKIAAAEGRSIQRVSEAVSYTSEVLHAFVDEGA